LNSQGNNHYRKIRHQNTNNTWQRFLVSAQQIPNVACATRSGADSNKNPVSPAFYCMLSAPWIARVSLSLKIRQILFPPKGSDKSREYIEARPTTIYFNKLTVPFFCLLTREGDIKYTGCGNWNTYYY
jgi:hypothetical protein